MSLIIKNYAHSLASHVTMWLSFKNLLSCISFSHGQCPLDRDFSFPHLVGLLILSLWWWQFPNHITVNRKIALLHYEHVTFSYAMGMFRFTAREIYSQFTLKVTPWLHFLIQHLFRIINWTEWKQTRFVHVGIDTLLLVVYVLN
jgi:hypothetical protein